MLAFCCIPLKKILQISRLCWCCFILKSLCSTFYIRSAVHVKFVCVIVWGMRQQHLLSTIFCGVTFCFKSGDCIWWVWFHWSFCTCPNITVCLNLYNRSWYLVGSNLAALLLFFKIVLLILSLLHFCISFRITLLVYTHTHQVKFDRIV